MLLFFHSRFGDWLTIIGWNCRVLQRWCCVTKAGGEAFNAVLAGIVWLFWRSGWALCQCPAAASRRVGWHLRGELQPRPRRTPAAAWADRVLDYGRHAGDHLDDHHCDLFRFPRRRAEA